MFDSGFSKVAAWPAGLAKVLGAPIGALRRSGQAVKGALTPGAEFTKQFRRTAGAFDPAVKGEVLSRQAKRIETASALKPGTAEGIVARRAATRAGSLDPTEVAQRHKRIQAQKPKPGWLSKHPILGTAGATAIGMKMLGSDSSSQPNYVGYPQPGGTY